MKKTTLIVAMTLLGQMALAGDCVLTTDRKVCPGKNKDEVLKPYNAKNPTVDPKKADDLAACEKLAEKGSKIVRKKDLTEKTVTATFDGKALSKSYTDKSDCK